MLVELVTDVINHLLTKKCFKSFSTYINVDSVTVVIHLCNFVTSLPILICKIESTNMFLKSNNLLTSFCKHKKGNILCTNSRLQ